MTVIPDREIELTPLRPEQQQWADVRSETLRIMYELWKRDAKPEDPAPTPEVIARREAWNMNPPCPNCGSYRHFEC